MNMICNGCVYWDDEIEDCIIEETPESEDKCRDFDDGGAGE
jgi:hypothetical protein